MMRLSTLGEVTHGRDFGGFGSDIRDMSLAGGRKPWFRTGVPDGGSARGFRLRFRTEVRLRTSVATWVGRGNRRWLGDERTDGRPGIREGRERAGDWAGRTGSDSGAGARRAGLRPAPTDMESCRGSPERLERTRAEPSRERSVRNLRAEPRSTLASCARSRSARSSTRRATSPAGRRRPVPGGRGWRAACRVRRPTDRRS